MKKPSALIIEDDQNLIFIYSHALQEAGFEIEVAGDGDMALTTLRNAIPDLILLDLHLPKISGKDIIAAIRSDDRLENTRIIVSSGDPLTADQIRHNVDLVLLKPVGFIQLRDLASQLSQSHTPIATE